MTVSWSSRDGDDRLTRPQTTRWWQSLRVPFALMTALLVLALLSLTSVASLWTLRSGAIDQLRSQASSQLSVAIVVAEKGTLPSNATNRASDIPPALQESVRRSDAASVLSYDDGAAMWAAVRSDAGHENRSGMVAVRIANGSVDSQLRETGQQLVLLAAALTILGFAGAWIIAGIATSRLRRLTHSVGETIVGGSAVRVDGSDEIAVLSAAVNSAAEGVQKSLARERNFAADIAHELRTPLTALVTAAHLLGPDPAAHRVRKQVTRLKRLTENLIELGRANAGLSGDRLPLGEIVVSSIAQLHDETLQVTTTGTSNLVVDARRFGVIIDNLVRNAHVHGASPITVILSESGVTILDSGSGYPNELLELGPRRFTDPGHHSGTGLGLSIVLEHANAVGAELILSNRSGGGAVSELRIPSSAAD